MFCENFEIAAVQKYANLVELEKCCQTQIFLQNFVLIQPRTSPLKFCKVLQNLIICWRRDIVRRVPVAEKSADDIEAFHVRELGVDRTSSVPPRNANHWLRIEDP